MKEYKWLNEVFDTLDDLHRYARGEQLHDIRNMVDAAKAAAIQELREVRSRNKAGRAANATSKPSRCRSEDVDGSPFRTLMARNSSVDCVEIVTDQEDSQSDPIGQ